MPLDSLTTQHVIKFGQNLFSSPEYLNFLMNLPENQLRPFLEILLDQVKRFQEFQDDQLIADFSTVINDQFHEEEIQDLLRSFGEIS